MGGRFSISYVGIGTVPCEIPHRHGSFGTPPWQRIDSRKPCSKRVPPAGQDCPNSPDALQSLQLHGYEPEGFDAEYCVDMLSCLWYFRTAFRRAEFRPA